MYLPLVDSNTVDLRSRIGDETLNKLSELSSQIPAHRQMDTSQSVYCRFNLTTSLS